MHFKLDARRCVKSKIEPLYQLSLQRFANRAALVAPLLDSDGDHQIQRICVSSVSNAAISVQVTLHIGPLVWCTRARLVRLPWKVVNMIICFSLSFTLCLVLYQKEHMTFPRLQDGNVVEIAMCPRDKSLTRTLRRL